MSIVSRVNFSARLATELKQPSFRRRFFRAQAEEEIAQQIRELRETRKLRQVDLAAKAAMKQSAVSRIEQASYSAWTFKTLLRVAEALDAQLRVAFEAAEDVIARYEAEELANSVEPEQSRVRRQVLQPTMGQPELLKNGMKLEDTIKRIFLCLSEQSRSSSLQPVSQGSDANMDRSASYQGLAAA